MIAVLDGLLGRLSSISRLGAWVGGSMMLAAAALISLEVLLRKLFLISLGGADEMASYALAIGTVWALAFASLQRAHIRVDALYVLLPTFLGAILDVLALVSMLIFAAALSWYGTEVLIDSWKLSATANTPIGTPLWIPQGLWVLGLWFFVATIATLLLRSIAAVLTGRAEDVSRLAGTKSIKEEISNAADPGVTEIKPTSVSKEQESRKC